MDGRGLMTQFCIKFHPDTGLAGCMLAAFGRCYKKELGETHGKHDCPRSKNEADKFWQQWVDDEVRKYKQIRSERGVTSLL